MRNAKPTTRRSKPVPAQTAASQVVRRETAGDPVRVVSEIQASRKPTISAIHAMRNGRNLTKASSARTFDSRTRWKVPSPSEDMESVRSSLRASSEAEESNPFWSPVWNATAIRVKASILRSRTGSDATSEGGISWGSRHAPSLPLGPIISRQSEADVASANFSRRLATSDAAFSTGSSRSLSRCFAAATSASLWSFALSASSVKLANCPSGSRPMAVRNGRKAQNTMRWFERESG
jgi:hypothetical protein